MSSVFDLRDDRFQALLVEGRLDGPVVAQPLGHLEDVAPWDEALRLPVLEGVELLAVVPRDRVGVAEAGCHQQQHARALALEERVQANRRPMNEKLDPAGARGRTARDR